jgi:HD superfamily phosphodiesterase
MILDKNGRIVVSRQFCKVSKSSLEEWGRNMPRLISKRQQHTFIEDNELRYVYQKIEDLYIALVCGKDSNMIEDMEILKTIHKVCMELLENNSFNEENI